MIHYKKVEATCDHCHKTFDVSEMYRRNTSSSIPTDQICYTCAETLEHEKKRTCVQCGYEGDGTMSLCHEFCGYLEEFYSIYKQIVKMRKSRKFSRKKFNKLRMKIQNALIPIIETQNTLDPGVLRNRMNLLLPNKYGVMFTKHMCDKLVAEMHMFATAVMLADSYVNYVPGEVVETPETTTEIIG